MDKNIAISDESLVNVSAGVSVTFSEYLKIHGTDETKISGTEFYYLYDFYQKYDLYQKSPGRGPRSEW